MINLRKGIWGQALCELFDSVVLHVCRQVFPPGVRRMRELRQVLVIITSLSAAMENGMPRFVESYVGGCRTRVFDQLRGVHIL
ncbi:hypothetical protein [Arthrobacter sp. SIMBA_036]|uniref:hypothetical protein n=1 Tax=Arthrobacter sp. SIMBA_036 TaxID=3085778 RepID=UPI00397D94D7